MGVSGTKLNGCLWLSVTVWQPLTAVDCRPSGGVHVKWIPPRSPSLAGYYAGVEENPRIKSFLVALGFSAALGFTGEAVILTALQFAPLFHNLTALIFDKAHNLRFGLALRVMDLWEGFFPLY